ncbi:MAG TPA: DUF5985 family protein [Gemmatimonadales bacterium]|nr:DUF5985 family protein [Gemmatimonadales bacterium]
MTFQPSSLLPGAIGMGSAVIGLFFLRFWRDGRDRLFLLFALSFFLQAANRVALALSEHPNEGNPWHYTVRLLSYLFIIAAIVDKNRVSPSGLPPTG